MSSSSHPDYPTRHSSASSGNPQQKFTVSQGKKLPDAHAPGTYDDASVIRDVLVGSMKRCGVSRQVIAERMTYLLGRSVTEKMLFAFTAASQNDRRWPAEFDRAFCEATGDMTLLLDRCRRAGLVVIDATEQKILEYGRACLIRKKALAKSEQLELELGEVEL